MSGRCSSNLLKLIVFLLILLVSNIIFLIYWIFSYIREYFRSKEIKNAVLKRLFLKYCNKKQISIDKLILNNEKILSSENIEEVKIKIFNIWKVMNKSIYKYRFITINDDEKVIKFLPGNWIITESIVLPKGYVVFCSSGTTIDLKNGSSIISYSPLIFDGSADLPIIIKSSDSNIYKLNNLIQYLLILNLKLLDNYISNY